MLMLTGCAPKKQTAGDGGVTYKTEFPLSALEYTIMTNKEIALVINILETHMTNGRNVIKGSYPAEDEISNVEHSLIMTDEAIDSVDTMYPANTYEDDRLDILRRLENAKNSLVNYKEALEEGDYDLLEGLIDVMKGDFVALKGMFNVQWE